MEKFNLVVFGITSNLSQLKIIPALYDLERQNLLDPKTRIIGIGRKDISISKFVEDVLHTENRHHQHKIDDSVTHRLVNRFEYLKEDVSHKDANVYKFLLKHQGNTLYYLATYPELYEGIFKNLKKFGLNKKDEGWTKILVEKPIGNNLKSAQDLNSLLAQYFEPNNIYRVDHYLGKSDLQDIFNKNFHPDDVDHVQLSVLENFGIGKRGVYYDATGALIDMGQNHFMQMIAAVTKKSLTVKAREEVIAGLVADSQSLVLGQYEGYLDEENIPAGSNTDTFFALKTRVGVGLWKNVPVYMRSGKKLSKSEIKISLIYKNGSIKSFVIISTGNDNKYDPYEKLILEAVAGNQFYFNSAIEVEAAWKFIDKLQTSKTPVYKYKPGTNGPPEADQLIAKDGKKWV